MKKQGVSHMLVIILLVFEDLTFSLLIENINKYKIQQEKSIRYITMYIDFKIVKAFLISCLWKKNWTSNKKLIAFKNYKTFSM